MEDHAVVDRPRKVVFVSNRGEQVNLCLKILPLQTQVLSGTLGNKTEGEDWGDEVMHKIVPSYKYVNFLRATFLSIKYTLNLMNVWGPA